MTVRTACKHCKRPFDARRMDAIYCGPTCRSAAAKERAKSRTQARQGTNVRRAHVLTSAFTRAINKAKAKTSADVAAVALARLYARTLDADPATLDKLGPQYLAVLVQLGMTPRARVETKAGDEIDRRRTALDELQDRRDSRKRRAAAVDASATGTHA